MIRIEHNKDIFLFAYYLAYLLDHPIIYETILLLREYVWTLDDLQSPFYYVDEYQYQHPKLALIAD
jgi:hypothetical protein